MTNPTLEQVEAARAEYDRSEDMCAALVAAAGVTPQESGEHLHIWSEVPCKPGRCRIAAPVEVDEAKLAEVLVRSLTYSTGLDAEVNDAIAAVQANAVAEWFRGGGQ